MVNAPYNNSLDRKLFGSEIPHRWAGSDATKVVGDTFSHSRLKTFVTEVLANPPGKRAPWSLSAAVYDAGGPVRMLQDLDEWFDPTKSDWAEQCSIINFDFIKNSKLVYFCYLANLKKASRKSRQA